MESGVAAVKGVQPLGAVVQIDDGQIRAHLDEVVRATVEETLNALLDAEADQLCGARKYERTEGARIRARAVTAGSCTPRPAR
jgi:transposase-like protein